MSRTLIQIGALMMLLAVVIGAFGAHGLEATLKENGTVDTFKTGSDYHFYHALGLLSLAFGSSLIDQKWVKWASSLMLLGILIFSGSLYFLSVLNMKWLGMITPIGGLCFIAAWACVIIGAKKSV